MLSSVWKLGNCWNFKCWKYIRIQEELTIICVLVVTEITEIILDVYIISAWMAHKNGTGIEDVNV